MCKKCSYLFCCCYIEIKIIDNVNSVVKLKANVYKF